MLTANRNTLLGAVAAAALLAGIGGIVAGRTVFAPDGPAAADGGSEEKGEAAEASAEAEHGLVQIDTARAASAGIKTERAEAGNLSAEVMAQATVAAAPEGEAALTARADGAVTRLLKRLGDPVRAGEAVAYLESRDAAAIAAERSSAAARAQAARSAYAREKRLYDAKVTARQDLEAAQAAFAEAEAELRRTQSSAAAARVSGDGRYLIVSSPISGRVTSLQATLGAFVSAGTDIMHVADPRRVQINGAVLPADAQRIRPGDPATLELPGGSTLRATVRSATPSLDPETRTATVVLQPNGSLAGLTPGQGLRVRITPRNTTAGDRIVLPEGAIQSVDGREVVFVQVKGGFQATPVAVGARSGGRAEIVSGLQPGSNVATTGTFLLKAELGKGEAEHE